MKDKPYLCDTERCTGCMACYAACNFNAIKIVTNELGILLPEIDQTKCRNCNRCAAVCPALNPVGRHTPDAAYALYTKDLNDQGTCASGGAATAMCRFMLESGGVVFGCGYAENGKPVLKMVSDENGLEELKGSKYVYAFPDKIYAMVKDILSKGNPCLFIATPCQIAGLNSFLTGVNTENLITVDLICHGTPPWSYLHEYICSKNRNNDKIGRVTFRGKNDFFLSVLSSDDQIIYRRKSIYDSYFTSFLSNLILRENCYTCPYASKERVSDITIGDFWGLSSEVFPEYSGRKSLLLTNTVKGKLFFKKISESIIVNQRSCQEAFEGNKQLNAPAIRPWDRDKFCYAYKRSGQFLKALSVTSIPRRILYYYIRNTILWFPRKIRSWLTPHNGENT